MLRCMLAKPVHATKKKDSAQAHGTRLNQLRCCCWCCCCCYILEPGMIQEYKLANLYQVSAFIEEIIMDKHCESSSIHPFSYILIYHHHIVTASSFRRLSKQHYVSPRSLWPSERLRNIVRRASFFAGCLLHSGLPACRYKTQQEEQEKTAVYRKWYEYTPDTSISIHCCWCRKAVGGVQEQNNKNNPKSTRRRTHSSI